MSPYPLAGSHLLYNLLAVVIEKFIDGVRQQLVLAVEKVVELDIDVTDPEINVEVGHLDQLKHRDKLISYVGALMNFCYLSAFRIYN